MPVPELRTEKVPVLEKGFRKKNHRKIEKIQRGDGMNVVRAAFSSLAAVHGHLWESAVQPSLMALPQGTRRYT